MVPDVTLRIARAGHHRMGTGDFENSEYRHEPSSKASTPRANHIYPVVNLPLCQPKCFLPVGQRKISPQCAPKWMGFCLDRRRPEFEGRYPQSDLVRGRSAVLCQNSVRIENIDIIGGNRRIVHFDVTEHPTAR